jgi:hypothetical protein
MNEQEFLKACEKITNVSKRDPVKAREECDAINQELASQNQRLQFHPTQGSMLAFFLYDATTNQELYRHTPMWIPFKR